MFHVEQGRRLAETLRDGAASLGVALTEDQIAQFVVYFSELTTWTKTINLTAVTEEREVAVKHFLDSLACQRALPPDGPLSLLDVGTGAGFPGLPLKIANPELALTLLEPSQKKIAFLRHMVGTLRLKDVTVLPKRVEQIAAEPCMASRFSVAITRALKLDTILPLIRRLLSPDGRLVLCRTAPLDPQRHLPGFLVGEEHHYDLPFHYGHRVLTVLNPTGS
ncbi:16S rRNA (guanine(527)-N(7))-methyltransferase RsmG [Nitrospira sp. Kam-Ns4a]